MVKRLETTLVGFDLCSLGFGFVLVLGLGWCGGCWGKLVVFSLSRPGLRTPVSVHQGPGLPRMIIQRK